MNEFQIRLRRRGISSTEIIDDIRRVAEKICRSTVTRADYDQHGQYGSTTVLRNFKKWNDAIQAAGLMVAFRQDISNDELFENLAAVWTRLGKQPFARQMSDRTTGSKFSTGTYEKRFGSWNQALVSFSKHISGGINPLASENIPINDVVSFTKRTPRNINWRLRARILIRDSCICKMCGGSPAKNPNVLLHVDHIIAWSKGGETLENNLQTLCEACNIGKSNVSL